MQRLGFTLGLIVLTGPAIACPLIRPDAQGDFYQNTAYTLGTAPSPLQAGHLWQVVADRLNCRSAAGVGSPVVRQFRMGELLQADVGRGGADEVLINALDRDRRPWMRVRSRDGQTYNCYVRANNAYITPYAAH